MRIICDYQNAIMKEIDYHFNYVDITIQLHVCSRCLFIQKPKCKLLFHLSRGILNDQTLVQIVCVNSKQKMFNSLLNSSQQYFIYVYLWKLNYCFNYYMNNVNGCLCLSCSFCLRLLVQSQLCSGFLIHVVGNVSLKGIMQLVERLCRMRKFKSRLQQINVITYKRKETGQSN